MAKSDPTNPFVVGKYISAEYFCDRETETNFLLKQVENGRNVAVVSPRRLGKTGLIHHFFNQRRIQEEYQTLFVDIYATGSLQEFVYLFGKTVYKTLGLRSRDWAKRFFQVISSLRVGFKLDPLTGEPSFDIGIGDIEAPLSTLDEIFEYLESSERPCIVAIDEFQQIASYSETNVEAALRTRIQNCRNTSFIFSGSKRHLMDAMFNSASKPFYQSAVILGLGSIPLEAYIPFAEKLFAERAKTIEPEAVEEVYRQFDGTTWFVQMMLNELFAITPIGETCRLDDIETAVENVVAVQSSSYKEILTSLSVKQRQLVLAIAAENEAVEITSSKFIKRHKLQSASSVQSALRPLLANDLLSLDDGVYRIYDRFLAHWLRNYLV